MDAPKAARLLMVEDNNMDIVLTLDAFREARLTNEIQVVQTGEQALKYLFGEEEYCDRACYPLPDLVLLDLKLPGMSGHEVLARVKSTPLLKRIPVIVLTSSKEEGDLEMSYDRGANSYLVKPITFEGFMETVKSIERYWLTLNVAAPK